MSKEQLFKKYGIDGSCETWQPEMDNWFSVEVYRVMHDGQLPPDDDADLTYLLDFLDKTKDPTYFFSLPDCGSLYLTARRMVYRFADEILAQISPTREETV